MLYATTKKIIVTFCAIGLFSTPGLARTVGLAQSYASLARGLQAKNLPVPIQPKSFAGQVRNLEPGLKSVLTSAVGSASTLLSKNADQALDASLNAIGETARSGGFPCQPSPAEGTCAINPEANRTLDAYLANQGGMPQGARLDDMISVRAALAAILGTKSVTTQKSASRIAILKEYVNGARQGINPLNSAYLALSSVISTLDKFAGKTVKDLSEEIVNGCK